MFADSIPGDLVMLIVNALYFKSAWTIRFEKANEPKRNFVVNASNEECKFVSNAICTSKYTAWNFLPKNLALPTNASENNLKHNEHTRCRWNRPDRIHSCTPS